MFQQIEGDPFNEIAEQVRSANHEFTLGNLLAAVAGFLILVSMAAGLTCIVEGWWQTDDETALRVLDDMGYNDVRLSGYRWFSCGKDDYYQTGFVAKSPTGAIVSGTVCRSYWHKSSTVRFD